MSGHTHDLDPLLLPGQRLFIVCLLAEMRWCDFSLLCKEFNTTPSAMSGQIKRLRDAGYVQTRRGHGKDHRRTSVRLTELGCERLTDHITALQGIVEKAGELIASAAARQGRRVGSVSSEGLET
ncbi:transcriptional regulator [Amycolatopsis sp. NPDC059657]|uniref:transcriptional regulator n=1 Tax=Amycolatopsis sp. NPDC059657 TaxID=3346899 RepID=UPI003670E4E0